MNEHRYSIFGATGGPIVFICECEDPNCYRAVPLTRAEYARRRPGLILAPGHRFGPQMPVASGPDRSQNHSGDEQILALDRSLRDRSQLP
jgi:hypothetical protein